MDFNLNDEQRLLREGVARFVGEQLAFNARPIVALARSATQDPAHWARFAELGWLGLAIPEALGGLGCSFTETAILVEEFGRGLVVQPYVAQVVLGGGLLEACAAAATARALLPGVAEGSVRPSLAHSEDGARYELAHLGGTLAEPSGTGFLIKGRKMLVQAADHATHFIVSALLPAGEWAIFLLPATAPGLTRRDYPLLSGAAAADLDLADVQLPTEALLARGPAARAALEAAWDRAVLASVAEALGTMEAAVDMTRNHLQTRVQFGRPLGQFQGLQHLMAECFVELQETRSILYRGMASLEGAPAQRSQAVSAAKAYAGQAARVVGAHCVQLHGAIGITEEHAMGHCWRNLVLFEKQYGDSEFHLRRAVPFA